MFIKRISIKKIITEWDTNSKFILLNLKSYFGHNDKYTKFIVLSRSRTGTNLLLSILNSNPKILCYSEVFRDFPNDKPFDTSKLLYNYV